MVHLQVVDDGQVKVLLDDGLRNMRGQLWVTLDLGHRACAIAFVGWLELGSCANRKRGDHTQVERGRVVVVDEKITSGVFSLIHSLEGW